MTSSVWGSAAANLPTRDVFATETFAILRALTPPVSSVNISIEVDGGIAKGDGLGGIFYFDPTSVLADDAVNTIAPTPLPATGRWRRVLVNFGVSLALGAGTVGAPSLTFGGDVTTGFYRPAADQIGISIAGVQKALFNASGIT